MLNQSPAALLRVARPPDTVNERSPEPKAKPTCCIRASAGEDASTTVAPSVVRVVDVDAVTTDATLFEALVNPDASTIAPTGNTLRPEAALYAPEPATPVIVTPTPLSGAVSTFSCASAKNNPCISRVRPFVISRL